MLIIVVIAASGGLLILATLLIRRRIGWIMITWTIIFGALIFGAAPIFVQSAYGPTVAMGRFLKELPSGQKIVCYLDDRPEGLVYYSDRKIVFLRKGMAEEDRVFSSVIRQWSPVVILTDKDELKKLQNTGQITVLQHIGRTYAVRYSLK
jgi:hypothetical protein